MRMTRAGALAAASLLALLPGCGGADLPPMVAGTAQGGVKQPRPLTQVEVASVTAWLERHRSGWGLVLATPPASTVRVTLDSAGQKAAVTLCLWPGSEYPGWRRTVFLYGLGGKPKGMQALDAQDLEPLFALTR